MIKVSAQTFSKASRRKSEINIRTSDLYDNLNTFLKIIRIIIRPGRYRKKYCLNLKII